MLIKYHLRCGHLMYTSHTTYNPHSHAHPAHSRHKVCACTSHTVRRTHTLTAWWLCISPHCLKRSLDWNMCRGKKIQNHHFKSYRLCNNKFTHLLFAAGIEYGIHDHQVLKYQPLVTPRLIFQYSIIINGIKWWNITLDVTDGWYFKTWGSRMPRSINADGKD